MNFTEICHEESRNTVSKQTNAGSLKNKNKKTEWSYCALLCVSHLAHGGAEKENWAPYIGNP